jgi:hypothetical protein
MLRRNALNRLVDVVVDDLHQTISVVWNENQKSRMNSKSGSKETALEADSSILQNLLLHHVPNLERVLKGIILMQSIDLNVCPIKINSNI